MKALWQKIRPGARAPERALVHDAGYDLASCQLVRIPARGVEQIPTGVAIALPEGYWAKIYPRSSTWIKGLDIMQAVIDGGYRGELFLFARNTTNTDVVVQSGERIAQLVPHRIVDLRWQREDSLPTTERGEDGFGSTG